MYTNLMMLYYFPPARLKRRTSRQRVDGNTKCQHKNLYKLKLHLFKEFLMQVFENENFVVVLSHKINVTNNNNNNVIFYSCLMNKF